MAIMVLTAQHLHTRHRDQGLHCITQNSSPQGASSKTGAIRVLTTQHLYGAHDLGTDSCRIVEQKLVHNLTNFI